MIYVRFQIIVPIHESSKEYNCNLRPFKIENTKLSRTFDRFSSIFDQPLISPRDIHKNLDT